MAADSRWPGFFPSAVCFVTASNGEKTALEKVVGATIVNRFPYILALSFCVQPLSERHYVRNNFCCLLEAGRGVAVHYFEPGPCIDKVMNSITAIPDQNVHSRIEATGLKTKKAKTNHSPVFKDAYLVYEGRLVEPGKDFEGKPIYAEPFTDHGSHRIYYLEIEAIQLREDIVKCESQISWKSLPAWHPKRPLQQFDPRAAKPLPDIKYEKGYTANYLFPSKNTIGFKYDKLEEGMAIRYLPPLPEDQVEIDNDMARWPCFFPSSIGMVSTWSLDGSPNLIPCGSTAVLVRRPLCIAICISYARINIRYAPRHSLASLQKKKQFICGVPFANDVIIDAVKYAGNVSGAQDPDKITNAGLQFLPDPSGPLLPALPLSYRCQVVKEFKLGTHIIFLGEVESVLVRDDATVDNNLKWYPFPDVEKANSINKDKEF